MDSIAAYGGLIISFLIMLGGGLRWALERRRRNRGQDIDDVDKLLERIAKMEERQAKEYEARVKMRNQLWRLEQAQMMSVRIITVAIEYIDVLSNQVEELGGKPHAKPPEIIQWLESHNGKEK